MKKFWLFIVAISFTSSLFAQATTSDTDTIPAKIKENFSSKFADASAAQWEIADSLYTVTFTFEKERHLIEYKKDGTVQLHRYDLNKSQYPSTILSSVSRTYPKYKIEDIERVENNGKVTYRAELEGKPDLEVEFDDLGMIISSKKE